MTLLTVEELFDGIVDLSIFDLTSRIGLAVYIIMPGFENYKSWLTLSRDRWWVYQSWVLDLIALDKKLLRVREIKI